MIEIFILTFLDSLEDLPMKEKVIDALVNGQSETEISTGTFFQHFEKKYVNSSKNADSPK